MQRSVKQSLGPLADLPGRHGADVPSARRTARTLRWLIRGHDPDPSADQWRAVGASLTRGDPPADRLATWMRTHGLSTTQPLFEQALNLGIGDVPDAPAELREFFQAVEATPDWLQPKRLVAGAKACHLSGLTGLQVLRDAALMGGYQASAINRTLVLTGALAKGAQRRVAETTKWWIDCTTCGGLSRFAPGFKSTVRVRLMHALVRQRVRALPEWDEAYFGMPVNQGDMQATYLGFSVIFLFGQRAMGVPLSRCEAESVMHLWRYIGWLMGVEDDLLFETEMEGRVGLYRNLLSQAPADDSSIALGRALMDEPLSRHYGNALPLLDKLQGRYERAKHLSICRFFLGGRSMSALGLPGGVLPWFPLMAVPVTALRHRLMRLLPGGHQALVRQGRAAQENYLAILFGSGEPDIARLPQPHG
ncbi:MAG: oxygenase MpaB family protein [Pseudomonadota bacterium]